MTTVVAPAVRTLAQVAAEDALEIGGKAANLGELVAAGLPVPPGFVLPAASYLDAMERADLRGELAQLHVRAVAAADDPAELDALCRRAAARCGGQPCPPTWPSRSASPMRPCRTARVGRPWRCGRLPSVRTAPARRSRA